MIMHRVSVVAVGIAVLATGIFAGDGEDASQADLRRFQGKWKVVSRRLDGQALKHGAVWTVNGNKMPFGGGLYAVLTLNAKETPRAVDYDHYDAGGRPRSGETGFKAIYMFEGENTLKWCTAAIAGRPRPKAFGSKQGDGNIYYILERVKE
jgi:uncharacterized protein (TIGR03067 family)